MILQFNLSRELFFFESSELKNKLPNPGLIYFTIIIFVIRALFFRCWWEKKILWGIIISKEFILGSINRWNLNEFKSPQ